MGILDAYKADVEANPNTDCTMPEMSGLDDSQKEEFKATLDGMRKRMEEYDKGGTIDGSAVVIKEAENEDGNPYEGYLSEEDMMARFRAHYPPTKEADLSEHITSDEARPIVKRAYCPQCGKEIVNTAPIAFNPFTMESVCRYDCECGWKANLEYAYPRVVFVTEDGVELNAYAK